MKDAAPPFSLPHPHAVRFYENDKGLSQIVADFLSSGLTAGEPGVIVATPVQRAAIVRELVLRGWDVVRLQRSRDLILLDADETLSTFMTNGTPDGEKFKAGMCAVIKGACPVPAACTLRIYGQMVDILWKAGHHRAAIRLEMLWNELANTEAFSLLCGYAMGHFYKDANFDEISRQHTHVVGANGEIRTVA